MWDSSPIVFSIVTVNDCMQTHKREELFFVFLLDGICSGLAEKEVAKQLNFSW